MDNSGVFKASGFDDIKREMDSLFQSVAKARYFPPLGALNIWHPPTDVYETDNLFVIIMEIAGIDKNELSIILKDRIISICGVREEKIPLSSPVFHNIEINYGPFERNIQFPCDVSSDNIKANYKNGFLTIEVEKKHPAKKDIDIE